MFRSQQSLKYKTGIKIKKKHCGLLSQYLHVKILHIFDTKTFQPKWTYKKIIPDQHLLHSQEVAEREFLGQLKISKFSRLALFYWSKLQQNTSIPKIIDCFISTSHQAVQELPALEQDAAVHRACLVPLSNRSAVSWVHCTQMARSTTL